MATNVITWISIFSLVCATAFAVVPSYIHVCGRRNPNLNKCIEDSIYDLLPKLRVGIPELDVPSLEPLGIDKIALVNLKDFHANATNAKISGLSYFQIRHLQVDLNKQKVDVSLSFKKIYMNSDFHINAKILVPIKEKGPVNMNTENVNARVLLEFKLVDHRGRKKMYFSAMKLKIFVKDYTATYQPGDNKPLTTAINAVLTDSKSEILESITPSLEQDISKIVLDLANRICQHFTYDELFPDRK